MIWILCMSFPDPSNRIYGRSTSLRHLLPITVWSAVNTHGEPGSLVNSSDWQRTGPTPFIMTEAARLAGLIATYVLEFRRLFTTQQAPTQPFNFLWYPFVWGSPKMCSVLHCLNVASNWISLPTSTARGLSLVNTPFLSCWGSSNKLNNVVDST